MDIISWMTLFFIVLIGGTLVGVYLSINNFQAEMMEVKEKIREQLAEERKVWNSLDCDGKKDELDKRDLSGDRIFHYSNSEDFYREYVINYMEWDLLP